MLPMSAVVETSMGPGTEEPQTSNINYRQVVGAIRADQFTICSILTGSLVAELAPATVVIYQ